MITQQVQVKLNLPLALKDYLASKAKKYDMPIAGYLKHLILNDVADLDYPVFQISTKSEKKAMKALKEESSAVKVANISQYFKKL
ncbi:MAG: hypothetical protein AAB966_03115 [Patescibacteria group bacterium]